MVARLEELKQALGQAGAVVRVLITGTAGSTPRETGASMLVWDSVMAGTIGGGTLEHAALGMARKLLQTGDSQPVIRREALGPGMGQCCGGAMTLLFERIDQDSLPRLLAEIDRVGCYARPIIAGSPRPTAKVESLMKRCVQQPEIGISIVDGWAVEPLERPRTELWVFGSGHVGRAVVGILANISRFSISWIDFEASRFPEQIPVAVNRIVAHKPEHIARYAPVGAHHLVFTHSHDLDLAICDVLLGRDFASLGLIGSGTKWARFRKRLLSFGHDPASVDRIRCPIGCKAYGKEPWAIATGVAAELLQTGTGTRRR